MDLVLIIALLSSLLGLVLLGGGGWLLYRIAWNRGYEEGSSEAVPMAGSCGGCGWEPKPGTIQDVMSQIVEHECPAADE